MKSIAQLYHQYVGRTGTATVFDNTTATDSDGTEIKSLGITFPVTITNVRIYYGREHVLIQPIHGEGSAWVWTKRVRLDDVPLPPVPNDPSVDDCLGSVAPIPETG